MKNYRSLIALVGLIALPSCANTGPNQNRGAAIGGLGGAGVGAIIGNQSGNAAAGAVIGGLSGAAIGGAVGRNKDKKEGY
ncbi:MAG: hypothetical protein RLZZ522_2244 [Verrucomicrobiota bacterium]|jgi:hypothetical protein